MAISVVSPLRQTGKSPTFKSKILWKKNFLFEMIYRLDSKYVNTKI